MGYANFRELYDDVINCEECALCKTRINTVFGEGSLRADVMFIGEAPGKHEDAQGRPFVGEAGMLLNKLLAYAGLDRADVYIANVLKCRPPYNRDPNEAERAACIKYLRAQTAFIKPKIIVCLGRIAAAAVLNRQVGMNREHGLVFRIKNFIIIPTYHPAALLRNSELITKTAADFRLIGETLRKETGS